MSNFNWPINTTTVSTGPVEFILNGVNTTVSKDTVTPSNSKPLPVEVIKPVAPNSNGTNSESTVSTVATITAPANAVGFILMNEDSSTTNMRWKIGSAAAANSGQQLQPGRDTGYVPCGANISICAESGTCAYNIQWIQSS